MSLLEKARLKTNANYQNIIVREQSLHGLNILHLSDLHLNTKTPLDELEEFVSAMNALEVDFIVITGDLIDCDPRKIVPALTLLKGFRKNVFYVSGNHDLFYGLEYLVSLLDSFCFLDNAQKCFEFNGQKLYLTGIADRFAPALKGRRDEVQVLSFLKEHEASIFLAHQPKDYKLALHGNAKLFLCGHTHGGQVFPFHFLVRLVQPFVKGLHYVKNTAIYVNKGLGTWGVNFRFMASAEVSVLKLRYKEA